jgi:GNAT superfamily N-acetyltransferase
LSSPDKLIIEVLEKHHEKSHFHCGNDTLDRYIARQAGQDIKRDTNRVFVAITPKEPNRIIGYYSLSALSIELLDLPAAVAKKLPRHQIPAALLGRLAVSEDHQRNGIGKILLADAVKRCIAASQEMAIYALVADPKDKEPVAFYKKFGLQSMSAQTHRLFLPLRSISNLQRSEPS